MKERSALFVCNLVVRVIDCFQRFVAHEILLDNQEVGVEWYSLHPALLLVASWVNWSYFVRKDWAVGYWKCVISDDQKD